MTTDRGTASIGLFVFALSILMGALLSFVVQPLAGRHLLPLYGGSSAVWIACLAFFQLSLLGSYLYAHGSRRLPARAELLTHISLLGLVAGLWPLALPEPTSTAGTAPALGIAVYLARHVGPTYFVLATSAPLLSRWYGAPGGRAPLWLYAVSNVGSLAGLLGYPLVIEPNLDHVRQLELFRGTFVAYVAACALCALGTWSTRAGDTRGARTTRNNVNAPLRRKLSWCALSASSSALLCSVSQHLTTDLAPSPILWVLPLALYLLSFVLAFSRVPYLPRLWAGLWIACTVALPILILPGNHAPLAVTLAVPLVTLVVGSMLMHHELAREAPEPELLTTFYVCIAAGGAFGGLLVSLAAPLLLTDFYELPLSMLAVHTLFFVRALSARSKRGEAPSGQARLSWLGFGLAWPVLCAVMLAMHTGHGRTERIVARSRSFFGPLMVADMKGRRVLLHGRTEHGAELLDPSRAHEPIGYFGTETALGRALRLHRQGHPRNLAVVGLGVGTMAAYAAERDSLTFYEIDPAVERFAREHFSYLKRARGEVSVHIGDGRLALAELARARPRSLDVLVLDAFASDAVPTHLLTREAFQIYAHTLRPDGVLLANVSNRYLRVERVVLASARENELASVFLESRGDPKRGLSRVRWAALAEDPRALEGLVGPETARVTVRDPLLFEDGRASLWALARGGSL